MIDKNQNHNSEDDNSTYVFMNMLYVFGFYCISIILLQSSDFALTQTPGFLHGFALHFPGPFEKIEALHGHGLSQRANNYENFISMTIAAYIFLLFCTVILFLYKNSKGKISLHNNVSVSSGMFFYLGGFLFALFGIYMVFFSDKIDYNSDCIFIVYNINESNLGYLVDVCFMMLIHMKFV